MIKQTLRKTVTKQQKIQSLMTSCVAVCLSQGKKARVTFSIPLHVVNDRKHIFISKPYCFFVFCIRTFIILKTNIYVLLRQHCIATRWTLSVFGHLLSFWHYPLSTTISTSLTPASSPIRWSQFISSFTCIHKQFIKSNKYTTINRK